MLTRISLIVAIVAGLAVGGINFIKVKEKITTLMTERDNERTQKETAQRDLASTKKELAKTTADLTQTKQTLETTTSERDKAVAQAASQKKRADQLTDELATTKKDRDNAKAALESYVASGLTSQQVVNLANDLKKARETIAGAQDENKVLDRKIKKLQTELAVYKTPDYVVLLPPNLKGKIVVSDPKWNFVVLNVGEDQGVLENGEFLVNRDGRLVAKVRVTSVQKDRCIANVMPGWRLGEVLEGDQVIPAHPASS
ncbi:MAG TPA: hypothetical protein VFM25_07820 [Verrucomicrobiae bacterium]|nr:hypothetical protein [Verrucomicrobiae bacterium]